MKRPTQADVARLAKVSTATVSYVVNERANARVPISEKTRRRVLDAVTELGYLPDARAQSLALGNTKTVGLIIPDIRNPHFWEHAEGVGQEARAAGYHILLSETGLDSEYEEDIFKDLSRRRIDGLILMGSFVEQSEQAKNILNQLIKRQRPIVEISDHDLDYNVDYVISGYGEPTREVVSYLLSLQHRRIAMIYGVATPVMAEDRLLSYQQGLQDAGFPVDQDLIIRCGPTIEDGYQAALQLLKLPTRPTALIAINDLLAIGALRAAADIGLSVPKDVSLVGFDGIHMADYLLPRLTTVAKDSIRVGREAVKQLLARINRPDLPQQRISIPTHLIIRESTGPAPLS